MSMQIMITPAKTVMSLGELIRSATKDHAPSSIKIMRGSEKRRYFIHQCQ